MPFRSQMYRIVIMRQGRGVHLGAGVNRPQRRLHSLHPDPHNEPLT